MTDSTTTPEGLGDEQKSSWPAGSVPLGERPIDRLRPGSPEHQRVLDYLLKRLEMSERAMSKFHSRWKVNEMKVQAYINLKKWEQVLKDANEKGEAPKVVSVVVPYSFATLQTIVTYLAHSFMGRKPMFQIGTYKKESTLGAKWMETVLQYNAEHTNLVRHLFQFLQDGEMYGVAILRTKWREEKAMRTVWTERPKYGFLNIPLGKERVRSRELRTVFAGNDVVSIDPFMFFPDPRVAMVDVNKKGEFVFWRTFEGRHLLKAEEAAGNIKWVDNIGDSPHSNRTTGQDSQRSLISLGDPVPGLRQDSTGWSRQNPQIDQGTIDIIPKELGLGDSDKVEKWIFAIGNKNQIIQAEPFDADHGMHPVAVAEPSTLGYGFGQAGSMDYIGSTQDTLSWLVNSHIANVRTALNNMLVVDPDAVEIEDLKNPDAGKIIRLKRSAWGRDVRSALSQLQVVDVTRSHISDFEMFMKLGDIMSSVTDNLRGTQDTGGRKSATEARQAVEAASSRLSAKARLISAQAISTGGLTEQMVLNILQYMPEDFYQNIGGVQGMDEHFRSMGLDPSASVNISPEMLVGDFHFPVHDGTLPLDKVALLEVWKEIFLGVASDSELRQQFSIPNIFEYVAELGGAKNISQFKLDLQVAPDAQLQQQAQAGNMMPLGDANGMV